MRNKLFGLAVVAAACGLAGWFVASNWSDRVQAAQDKTRIKIGKYEYISAGLMSLVMIDTESGKMWALAPPSFGGFDRDDATEFVWVPITKFDDVDVYRKWWRQRAEDGIKERMRRERLYRDKYYDYTTKAFEEKPTYKYPETTRKFERTEKARFETSKR